MIISVNWLKKYTDITLPVAELATRIGERLVEIEAVIDLGAKYQGVIVANVVECVPLENSDHLNVTKIDDGGVAQGVERDENGYVQVVCGAPNVRAGLLVAWLPPQSTVPETYGTAEPFVLGAKPLRGVMSNGMLASARELDLYDDHSGILEIDKDAQPGTSFAELYELNDYLLDIENKSLTHRPDAFGVIGFAREVAGIQGQSFQTPAWLEVVTPVVEATKSIEAPTITITDPALSERFQAIVIDGVNENAQSPIEMQTYLARSGVRPINASVDISNYLMLLTGQPTHAYDYDKLKAVAGDDFTVRVRTAYSGEKLVLLDGKEIELDTSDIVIAAGETAVGLAGIMGGKSTATDTQTKTVLFEAATFDLYHMRASHMRHGIFSEAVTRFTKGIPAPLSAPVLQEALHLFTQYGIGEAASDIVEDYPVQPETPIITLTEKQINETLGTEFSASDIVELLQNVGFGVVFQELTATVTVPYWRKDIHIPEDVIEEIGRLAGFDTINLTLPRRDFTAVRPSDFDELRSFIRNRLVRAGANEVLTYSFVHGDMLKKAGQDLDEAYRIVNSISPDLQYYRLSLTPSLLSNIQPNVKAGYESFALFECNKVHSKRNQLTEENVPLEEDRIALALTHSKHSGSAFYDAKSYLEYVVGSLGGAVRYEAVTEATALYAPFEPKRSARIIDAVSGDEIGVIGEYRTAVQKAFKLPGYTAGFEVRPRALLAMTRKLEPHYRPLSKYPGTERDICFQVSAITPYSAVAHAAQAALAQTQLISTVQPLDIYQAPGADTKNITLKIQLGSYEKTMTSDEVSGVVEMITQAVIQETEGEVV